MSGRFIMYASEALAILELTTQATQQEIKAAYKKLAKKYHPDLNPLGEDMMKIINEAYETLSNYQPGDAEFVKKTSLDKIEEVLQELLKLPNIELEIIGTWIWVFGDTKTHKDTLKSLGLNWSSSKKRWYYSGQKKKFRRGSGKSFGEIRVKYGSQKVSHHQITAN